jgi:hypothetical protein
VTDEGLSSAWNSDFAGYEQKVALLQVQHEVMKYAIATFLT